MPQPLYSSNFPQSLITMSFIEKISPEGACFAHALFFSSVPRRSLLLLTRCFFFFLTTTVSKYVLWEDPMKSAAVLGGATLVYVSLERMNYNIINIASNVAMVSVLVLALWTQAAAFMPNRYDEPPQINFWFPPFCTVPPPSFGRSLDTFFTVHEQGPACHRPEAASHGSATPRHCREDYRSSQLAVGEPLRGWCEQGQGVDFEGEKLFSHPLQYIISEWSFRFLFPA